MIIIPDVHGRSFWKNAIKEKKENEKVVFLGDYLDSYSSEFDTIAGSYITKESTLENFKEILEYAKSNPKDVILLLGNHDTEYFLGTPDCRMDINNFDEISKLFMSNLKLFDVAYYIKEGNLTYTFSHTCLTKGWIEKNFSYFGKDEDDPTIIEVIEEINYMLHGNLENFSGLGKILGQVGASRWGWCEFGSIVWADMSDLQPGEWPGVHQIFGHTQQREYPVYNEDFSMLDCRKAFRLTPETGSIEVLLSEKERNSLGESINNYNRDARKED